MAFDVFRFLIGQTLAEREGVSRSRATQLALVPAFLDMPLPVALVMAQTMARREAPVNTPSGSASPQAIQIPDVLNRHYEYGRGFLEANGFTAVSVTEGDSTNDRTQLNLVYEISPQKVTARSQPIELKFYAKPQLSMRGGESSGDLTAGGAQVVGAAGYGQEEAG